MVNWFGFSFFEKLLIRLVIKIFDKKINFFKKIFVLTVAIIGEAHYN